MCDTKREPLHGAPTARGQKTPKSQSGERNREAGANAWPRARDVGVLCSGARRAATLPKGRVDPRLRSRMALTCVWEATRVVGETTLVPGPVSFGLSRNAVSLKGPRARAPSVFSFRQLWRVRHPVILTARAPPIVEAGPKSGHFQSLFESVDGAQQLRPAPGGGGSGWGIAVRPSMSSVIGHGAGGPELSPRPLWRGSCRGCLEL